MEPLLRNYLRNNDNGKKWTNHAAIHDYVKAEFCEYNQRELNQLLQKLLTNAEIEKRIGKTYEYRLVPNAFSCPYDDKSSQTRNKSDIKNKSHFVKHFIQVVKSNEKGYANKSWIKELPFTSQGKISAYQLSFGKYQGIGKTILEAKFETAWSYFSKNTIFVPDHFFC